MGVGRNGWDWINMAIGVDGFGEKGLQEQGGLVKTVCGYGSGLVECVCGSSQD